MSRVIFLQAKSAPQSAQPNSRCEYAASTQSIRLFVLVVVTNKKFLRKQIFMYGKYVPTLHGVMVPHAPKCIACNKCLTMQRYIYSFSVECSSYQMATALHLVVSQSHIYSRWTRRTQHNYISHFFFFQLLSLWRCAKIKLIFPKRVCNNLIEKIISSAVRYPHNIVIIATHTRTHHTYTIGMIGIIGIPTLVCTVDDENDFFSQTNKRWRELLIASVTHGFRAMECENMLCVCVCILVIGASVCNVYVRQSPC